MTYRMLGRTGFRVSTIGFGASPLGDVFGTTDPEEGNRAVHMAVDEGINFFDVSPYYGLTLAEERLGAALAGRRERVVLSTKCGRYGAARFDFSPGAIAAGLEDSLRRLRTDRVDLLLAHDIEFGSAEQIVGETLPAMRRLQEQGKTRSIGISGYPLELLARVAENFPVDAILSYCHYDLLADDLDSTLTPVAASRNIGLINASPLHMGLLTEQGPPAWHPATEAMRAAVARARELCRGASEQLSDLALRYCFQYTGVGSTLVGMATRDHVRSSLRSLQVPLNPQLLAQVRVVFAPVFNVSWSSGRLQTPAHQERRS